MTLIMCEDGRQILATSIYLPKDLVDRARSLGINRSGLFRTALQQEIERIEDEQGQDQVANRNAPTHPFEKRRITFDPGSP